jgi:hypothetical protein
LTGWARLTSGGSVTSLAQDLTASATWATDLDQYESELVKLRGAVDGGFATAGGAYESAFFTTTGLPQGNVKLRVPAAVRTAADITQGCELTLTSPLWRFNTQAQPHVWAPADAVLHSCPAPVVAGATGTSATTVQVTFSRQVAPASVAAAGTQFTFDNGLTATAAVVSGRTVTVTTGAQVAGEAYVVTVAQTVTDTLGTPLGTPATATFTAPLPNNCTAPIVISAVYGGGGNSGATYSYDYVELKNRTSTAIDLTGYSLQYTSSSGTGVWTPHLLTGTVPANGYFLARGAIGATVTNVPLPAAHDQDFPLLALSGTNGTVALVNGTAALASGCPAAGTVVDMAGYGTAACREGANASTSLTNSTATFRTSDGCFDTNINAQDFVPAAVSSRAPRNTAVTTFVCTCP